MERARSDTGGKWQREQEWAEKAIDGVMSQDALRRSFWIMGNDNYMEDDGLEFCGRGTGVSDETRV